MSLRCIFVKRKLKWKKDFMTRLKACILIMYLLSVGTTCTILGK